MSLRTNLATRPFYNERAVHAGILAVTLLVVAATAFNGWQLVSLTRRDRSLGAESAASDTLAPRRCDSRPPGPGRGWTARA